MTALCAALAACAPTPPAPLPEPRAAATPRETLPPGLDAAAIRAELIATARIRYGEAAVQRALASPAYVFAKRFIGMAPPPPPGAGPDWRPPTPAALLIKANGEWLVATADGWRPARPEAALEIDRRLAEPRLWSEAAFIPPCPDFGANLLLLKIAGRPETVRQSLCTGAAADLVQAALSA